MEITMSRIFKIAKLINCKLTNTSPNHQNLLLVNTVFAIAKNKDSSNRIFGDIGHYKNLFEKEHKRIKDIENQISHTLKRHNKILPILNNVQNAIYLQLDVFSELFLQKHLQSGEKALPLHSQNIAEWSSGSSLGS